MQRAVPVLDRRGSDNGTCQSVNAYRIEKGDINGVDVSGLAIANACLIPGNVLRAKWRVIVYVDDRATPTQEEALVKAFLGELGGPLKDLAGLVGEVVATRRAPITFTVKEGKGALRVGDGIDAEMEPYRGPSGENQQV